MRLKKRGKIVLAAVIVAVCAAGAIFGGIYGYEKHMVKSRVESEIQSYKAQANTDGIVDSTPDPYFIKKQAGYAYRVPETIVYDSSVTGTKRHAMVCLPADYKENKQYPVLYLLHGYGGSHRTWHNKEADVIAQNLHYFENVPEMILVYQNCNVNAQESVDDVGYEESIEAFDGSAEDLVTSLMPYINSHYSVIADRDHTAIAGNSMGGRNSLYAAYTYPDIFGYVGAFSSGPTVAAAMGPEDMPMPALLQELQLPEGAKDFDLLMLAVGKSDDVCGITTYEMHDYMTEQQIPHIFYDTEGGHQTVVWQNALYNFMKKLFV